MNRLEQIPTMVEGTLTTHARRRGGGEARVYHQLQRWLQGRNDSRHISSAQVQPVQAGIEGYRQAQALLRQIAHLDESAILAAPPSESKKKPTRR